MLCPRIASTPRSKQGSFQVIASYERGMTAAPHAHRDSPPWRAIAAGPAVAVVTLVTALIVTDQAGVPLRDPNGVSVARFTSAAALVAVLVGLDIVFRSGRKRWTPVRVLAVVSALVSFYVTYLAYRNLKSVVPLLRPDELFDGRLADLDRTLFAGSDPADVLHSVLGSGISAHALSGVYEGFFLFIPLALAFALVVLPDLRAGLFLTTALAINWMLAAGSYFLLPSLGPIYAESAQFARAPEHRRERPAAGPARAADGVPARPVRGGHRAEHRRLRLAARLDLLHRRARDAPAGAPAVREDCACGSCSPLTVAATALLRVALRAR